MVGSKPTDSTRPLPDINAPHRSTSSMSIEDVNLHNINYGTVLNSNKCMMNFSIKNSINVPTTGINNFRTYITPDMYTTVRGMLNCIYRRSILFMFLFISFYFFLIFDYYLKLYDPASIDFPALEYHDQKSLTSQFKCDAPSRPSDVTFAYSAFPNQTNVSYTNNVRILSLVYRTIICILIFIF